MIRNVGGWNSLRKVRAEETLHARSVKHVEKSSRNERRHLGQEFRLSAVALVEEQGYTKAQALVIHENLLRTWRMTYGKVGGIVEGIGTGGTGVSSEGESASSHGAWHIKKSTAFVTNEKN